MAFLVLGEDITNAHHVPDDDLGRLVNDCLVSRAGGHEAATIWKCERKNGPDEPSHIFHIVTSVPSYGEQMTTNARERSLGRRDPRRGPHR
jgi:hypothetical protein